MSLGRYGDLPPEAAIEDLAESARDALSDGFDDDQLERFEALPPVEQVAHRYAHADCDDFAAAIGEATGWPVVAVMSRRAGPMHRLVEAPDGRMLDVRGWVTIEDLATRYRRKDLVLVKGEAAAAWVTQLDEEQVLEVLYAALQMPVEPFTSPALRAKLLTLARSCGMPDVKPPRKKRGSGPGAVG